MFFCSITIKNVFNTTFHIAKNIPIPYSEAIAK